MNPDARLRRALSPVDPPEGFAQRVRARAEQQARAARSKASRRLVRWFAVAAALLAVVGGPVAWREYEQRREALAARAQVLLALQIASRELNTVHRHVVRPIANRPGATDSGAPGKEGRP